MDLCEPPLAGRSDGRQVVPVGGVKSLVPEDVVGDEVPIPDRVVRRARHQPVPLLGRQDGECGDLAVRDVSDAADKAGGRPLLEDRSPARRQPSFLSGPGVVDPILDVEGARPVGIECGANGGVRDLPVIRMKARQEGARIGDRLVGPNSEQLANPSVPVQAVGVRDEVEDADAGSLHRESLTLFGCDERLLDPRGLLVGTIVFRAIAQDLQVTDMDAVGGGQPQHLPQAKESRPVLAPMPALVGTPAGLPSRRHLLARDASLDVLRHEDDLRRLAAHLGLRPAEDAFRTRIPARNETVEVRRHDRVVDRAIDDLAVPGVGLAHVAGCGLPGRDRAP